MAALIFADNEADTITFRKAIFRLILDRARARLTDPVDLAELDLSEAVEGISFYRLPDGQRARMAQAVAEATISLKQDLAAGRPVAEELRPGAQEKLDQVLTMLARFRGRTSD
jgi:hypothetical protein